MKKIGIVSGVTFALLLLLFLLDLSHIFTFIAKGVVNIHFDLGTKFFEFISFIHDFNFVVVIAAILFVYSFIKKDVKNLIRIAVAIFILGALVFILKKVFGVARPDIMQLVPETSNSFPSGHSASALVLYGLLYCVIIKDKFQDKENIFFIIATTLIILTGFGRIYLGVHWLPDILAGYLIGFYALFIANFAAVKLYKKAEKIWGI